LFQNECASVHCGTFLRRIVLAVYYITSLTRACLFTLRSSQQDIRDRDVE
jgi:hypothetical protein